MKNNVSPALALLTALGFLAFSPARAELPPSAYESMKKAAPEVLEIEVTRVARSTREADGRRHISIYADAIVRRVVRSKSRTRSGARLSLRYLTFDILEQGWAGPGRTSEVQKGKRYRVWLKKSGAHFYTAAQGQSIEEL